jgi:hypothetical protein
MEGGGDKLMAWCFFPETGFFQRGLAMAYHFELVFHESEHGHPTRPCAQVALEHYCEDEFGNLLIVHPCKKAEEFDAHVAQLIDELTEIRSEARKKFAAAAKG